MKLDSAIWSAVAASFAALSAFLTMRIHRRNFIESVRPELVLEDWTRTEQRSDTITFRRIRNVGRGPAFRIMLNCHVEAGNRPQAVCSSRWVPLIAAGESIELEGDIHIWWDNVEAQPDGSKYLSVPVEILYSDRREWRYKTIYPLLASPPTDNVLVVDAIVPGVMLSDRKCKSTPVRWLRFRGRLARIPLIRRAIKAW